jgi:hypothetical protein
VRITFYLDKPSATTSAIMLNISMLGKRLRFGTGVTLEPRHWNNLKQEPRSSDPHRNANVRKLAHIRATVTELYNALSAGNEPHSKSAALVEALRDRVRASLSPELAERAARPTMPLHFEEFIATYTMRSSRGLVTAHRPNEASIKRYRHVLNTLEAWSTATGNQLRYEDMTVEFYLAYSAWLSQTRSLSDATVSNYIKTIKTFLRWAKYKGYHANSDYGELVAALA